MVYDKPSVTLHSRHPLYLRAAQSARPVLCGLLLALLSACKITVTVPAGGRVVTEDGFECLAGQTCEIEVDSTNFDSTFTAIAEDGYTFARWRDKTRAFCGNRSTPCYLSTSGFVDKPKLLEVLASDRVFFLEPVFINYDLPYWRRTLREIDLGTRTGDAFLYTHPPAISACDPGSLTPAARNRALQALNQNRSLHSLPRVTYDGFYNMQVQEASLVQAANLYLDHSPAPSDACFTSSASDGAASSNLSLSSRRTDPAADVFGWTNDNNNVGALMEAGHRRWNLYPELGYTSYGKVEGASALKVLGFGMPPVDPVPADLEYVAVPYKSYPYILVSQEPRPTPWSISMIPRAGESDAFDYFVEARITVVDQLSGARLSVTNVHRDSKRAGLANFLSWMVQGWQYDRNYQVQISNIRMPDGSLRNIDYPVMVDRYNLLDLDYPREPGDSRQERTMTGNFNMPRDTDSYSIVLSGDFTVGGRSGLGGQFFFIRIYDKNKRLLVSSDQPFTRKFAWDRYTVVISPCDENGLCYLATTSYRVTIN